MNMKNLLFTLCGFFAAFTALAQTTQEIATGAGYQKQSYVNLSAGTEHQVLNDVWDIAFSVSPDDAGIFMNESSGSISGQPQPTVEVYYALTENFDDQPVPDDLLDFYLLNAEKTWQYGAFNEVRDTTNALDLGWGLRNAQTGDITGTAVYVIKLRSGLFLKFKVESLINGVYTFKYAKLDGTNLTTKTIKKSDFSGHSLAYFSLETGEVADVEPASGGYDLIYCRYIALINQPGTTEYLPYNVTGVLNAPGVRAVKADGVDPVAVQYADYQDNLSAAPEVIGHDWKNFSGTAWSLDQDRVFFVKTLDTRVWKIRFVTFSGSTSGKTKFEKTDLGLFSAATEPGALGISHLIAPNPAGEQFELALDVPEAAAGEAQLRLFDMQGRVVYQQAVSLQEGFQVKTVHSASMETGLYQVSLQVSGQTLNLGKITIE